MITNEDKERIERLELDIDTRILDLWAETAAFESWGLAEVAMFARAAYAKGYQDALCERDRGKMLRENGYRVPVRVK